MVRKTACAGLPYLFGLFFASFFDFRICICIFFALVFLTGSYIFCFKNKSLTVCALCFCFGLLLYSGYSFGVDEKIAAYDGCGVSFSGKITEVDFLNDDKAVYTVSGTLNAEEKVRLRIYYDACECEYGDWITVEGTASKLTDSISFPTESYYSSKGIFLEINGITAFEIVQNDSFSLVKAVLSYRDYMIRKINSVLVLDEGDFLTALLCGDTSELDASLKRSLYRSGIGHITAVSGAHLSIISGLLIIFLRKLNVRKSLRLIIAEAVIVLFVIFAGMRISVLRAAIMLTIVLLGTAAKRRHDILTSISLAGIALTIVSPYAVRDAAFLLSFSGVFGIGVFAPFVLKQLSMKGRLLALRKAIVSMLCISLCTFPFAAMTFDELSLISPISNIILVPLCSAALMLGVVTVFFGGASFAAYPLLTTAGLILKAVIFLSKVFSRLPFAYISLGYNFILFSVILCISGIFVVLLVLRTKKAMLLSVFMSVTIMLSSVIVFEAFNSQLLRIAVLSQGSSTAAVIYKGNTAAVIDLEGKGGISSSVERLLASKGIKSISLLVLNDNSLSNISTYLDSLSVPVEKLAVADGNSIGDAVILSEGDRAELLGCELYYYEKGGYALSYGDFKLMISQGNFDFLDSVVPLLAYGNNNISLRCGDRIFDYEDDLCKAAFLISVEKSGECYVRRLGYALRE